MTKPTIEVQAARQTFIDSQNESIAMFQKILTDIKDIDPRAWIVRVDGVPVQFDVDDKGNVSNSRMARVDLATKFDRRNAEHIAQAVQNGAGAKGEAVHLTVALRDTIRSLEGIRDNMIRLMQRDAD